MIDLAYAMPQPSGEGGEASFLTTLLPMILVFAVFYLLLIRPQQKKAKEHQVMLRNLKKGDSVMTQGGLFGTVVALSDRVVTLEIAEKVRVRVSRAHVAGITPSTTDQNS